MRQEVMEVRQALAAGGALPWALLFTYGGASLGKTPPHVAEEELEELIEARFFSEEQEIHIYRDGGTLRAASLSDTPEDTDVLEEKYALENSAFGEWIAVRRYLGFDEDGQAFTLACRLAGWKGGVNHG